MRIAMVAPRYCPFVGGTETHVKEVSTRLAALGHHVTVLTTDITRKLPPEEVDDGVQVKRVDAWPHNSDFYWSPAIYREVSRMDADIVHFQGYHNFVPILGMTAAIRRHLPYVLTFHSGGHSSKLRNMVRGAQHRMLGPLLRRADHLIGVSEYETELFADRTRIPMERFSVIPNGAKLPPPSEGLETDPKLILSVGRLEQYKGHHHAIEAYALMRNYLPGNRMMSAEQRLHVRSARLMIVGSGPYEPELRALVTTKGLDEHVKFASFPPSERQAFTDLLASAGLVVLLSDYEAHPLSVMEAISVGRRVLVTDTTGLREIARKGLARAIPVNARMEEIAGMMASELLRTDPVEVVPLADWDDCTSRLLQVYQQVIQKPSSSVLQTPRAWRGRGAVEGSR